MSFRPRVIQIRAGETVRLVISNRGTLRHEFVKATHAEHLEHRAMMRRTHAMDMANDPNVEFSCDIPGHAEAGMTGMFRLAP